MAMPQQIYGYGQANQPQTAQGLRLNTKSPGRSTGAPGGGSSTNAGGSSNFAPMTYGAAAAKQQHLNTNSMGEAYNYSIPSDTFYPMMQMGGGAA